MPFSVAVPGPGMGDDPGDHPSRERDRVVRPASILNPLWLMGAAPGGHALVLESVGLPLATALEGVTDTVTRISVPADRLPERAEGSFTLVVSVGWAPPSGLLQMLRARMEPGGRVVVAVKNRWFYGRFRGTWRGAPGAIGGGSVARGLLQAGFEDVRSYWVAPTLTDPRVMVPTCRPTTAVVEELRGRSPLKARGWRWLARVGVHRALLPAIWTVARR